MGRRAELVENVIVKRDQMKSENDGKWIAMLNQIAAEESNIRG
jgi:hypothetical protein